LATAVPGALLPVLLAALSARLFRRRGLAIATGALAAVCPPWLAGSDARPSLPLVFLLVSAFLLLVATDRPSSNFAVLSGAALALAVVTRPSALILVPSLAAPLFDRRYPRRINAHVAGSVILGLFLVLGPVLANAVLAGHRLVSRTFLSHADPMPGAHALAATIILGPLAAIGIARAERRGCAWFCAGVLAATSAGGGFGTPTWDAALLLYGAFGAVSLVTRGRDLETEAA
jgi:hypothetical protein